MEVVEDVVTSTLDAAPVHEPVQVVQPDDAQPSQPPGSLTKVKAHPRHKLHKVLAADGFEGDWNKFAREYVPKKSSVHISSYSKEEAIRRRLREKERREIQDRNAKLMLHRAEGEAARQQQDKERALAERKAWAQAKFEQRQEKISRAAEERKKREVAYCQLLEKTQEGCCSKGCKRTGRNWWQLKSERSLKSTRPCSRLPRKSVLVTSSMLMICTLHSEQCSVVNNETIISAKHKRCPWHSLQSMSPLDLVALAHFPLQLELQRMPGAGSTRQDSSRDPSPQPRRNVNRVRRPSPSPAARSLGPRVDRASSPLALPGVEITVHELPTAPQTDARHEHDVAAPSQQASHAPQEHVEAEQDQGIPIAVEVVAVEEVVAQSPGPEDVAVVQSPAQNPESPLEAETVAEAREEETAPTEDTPTEVGEQQLHSEEDATVNDSATVPEVAADMSGELEEDATSPKPDDAEEQGKNNVTEEGEGQKAES